MRLGGVADRGDLGHQLVVDVQAAGGVEHHHVVAAEGGLLRGALGDRDGVLAGDDRQGVDADLLAEDGELLHRRRAAGVERGHQHALALALLEALGELGGGGGLAGALQADHQDRRGRRVDAEVAGLALAAQHVDERVVDDLDDLLAGGDRLGDRLARGLVGDRLTKSRATGSETSASSSAVRTSRSAVGDVLVGERALAGQRPKTPDSRSDRVSNMAPPSLKRRSRRWAQRADRRRSWKSQDRRVRDSPGTCGRSMGGKRRGQPRFRRARDGGERPAISAGWRRPVHKSAQHMHNAYAWSPENALHGAGVPRDQASGHGSSVTLIEVAPEATRSMPFWKSASGMRWVTISSIGRRPCSSMRIATG